METSGKIESVAISTGESAKGTWTRWAFKVDGKTYSTFDKKLGDAFKAGDYVKMTLEQDGKFMNLTAMEHADAPKNESADEVMSSAEIVDLLRQILAELKKFNAA
jgi:hypothetical protein